MKSTIFLTLLRSSFVIKDNETWRSGGIKISRKYDNESTDILYGLRLPFHFTPLNSQNANTIYYYTKASRVRILREKEDDICFIH